MVELRSIRLHHLIVHPQVRLMPILVKQRAWNWTAVLFINLNRSRKLNTNESVVLRTMREMWARTLQISPDNFSEKILTLTNKYSRKVVLFKKQASESRLCLFNRESIHLSSLNLLNLNSSFSKITPALHNHFQKGKK